MTESTVKSIALIGMSNIGKTHWTRRLAAEYGFAPIDCDVIISGKLRDQLTQSGVRGLAQWMGQPYEARYAETSLTYLEYEQMALDEALTQLETHPKTPFVLDTTGSVIYTGAEILTRLREATRVIYFESSTAHVDDLFKRFSKSPEPLIWGPAYAPHEGESARQSLKRCYGDLLAWRAEHYRALAHVTIPYDRHHAVDADIGGYIKEALS